MGTTVTSIEQVNQIRRELREYDLSHSTCPVDRRRAEKGAEQRAQEAQAAQEQKNTANLKVWVEHRIGQWFTDYFGVDDDAAEDGHRKGHYSEAISEVLAIRRKEDRECVKQLIEQERRSFDAKLAALEQASNDRCAVIEQHTVQHIESAREPVLKANSEVLGHFRAELKEFKDALAEKERSFDAKLAALEQASNERWLAIDQRVDQRIERAREAMLLARHSRPARAVSR